jgi:hypothetical protein
MVVDASELIVQRIQGFVRIQWEGRNNALHKHNHSDVEKFRTLEAAEIRHFHTQPHLLPASGRPITIVAGSLVKSCCDQGQRIDGG